MGIKFNSFKLKAIDISQFNGIIDWQELKESGIEYVVIRVGYGNTIDSKFVENVSNAKKYGLKVLYYWYMDFYNNYIATSSVYGMDNTAWGKKQATNCWNAIKPYWDGNSLVFIDVESTNGNYAPKIETVQERAQTIMGGFLSEIDILTTKTNGIYCSLGLLSWFYAKWKTRPLWMAWYPYRTATVTVSNAIASAKAKGWDNLLLWQYASDGDIDDNGTSDGRTVGMQYDFLDLNGVVDESAFLALFNQSSVVDPVDTSDDDNDDETNIPSIGKTRTIEVKTSQRTLTLRKKPQVSILTYIKQYSSGIDFDCLEEVKDSFGNVWQRVGIDQYIADTYGGVVYLK
jgi:GH25 family lysozyme M1 (1,4-beta-N-acetylmuramidase)